MPRDAMLNHAFDWLAASKSHPYVVVDVFTPRPLEGNQLGVFLDGGRSARMGCSDWPGR
jgi:hypothetical protein